MKAALFPCPFDGLQKYSTEPTKAVYGCGKPFSFRRNNLPMFPALLFAVKEKTGRARKRSRAGAARVKSLLASSTHQSQECDRKSERKAPRRSPVAARRPLRLLPWASGPCEVLVVADEACGLAGRDRCLAEEGKLLLAPQVLSQAERLRGEQE